MNKRKIKRPHVKEYSYADTRGEKPDYSYVYIPINKKEKYHRSQTKKLLAKKGLLYKNDFIFQFYLNKIYLILNQKMYQNNSTVSF